LCKSEQKQDVASPIPQEYVGTHTDRTYARKEVKVIVPTLKKDKVDVPTGRKRDTRTVSLCSTTGCPRQESPISLFTS
jgi:hypothetical protein